MGIGRKDSIITRNNDIVVPTGVRAEIELERAEKFNELQQEKIEEYNNQILSGAHSDIDRFKDRKYLNNAIIVKLLKHDWIDKNAPTSTLFTQVKKNNKIYIETPTMGKEAKLIDNPLPYRFEGIIVAMDNRIPTKDDQFSDLTVGTFIRTISFDLKEDRYYFDETKREIVNFEDVMNLGSNLFPYYEGYARIHPGMIEHIYFNPEELRT